ncbi:MAG: Group 1 glycosyl transferase [Candidatus Saccharibacteria bacterium]|nr:Group 1 glycosyl transferase [Candidatus Saccharibacteria bacterium]
MKVALIASPYVAIPPKSYGGTELVILNLINGLKEQGHEPILLGPGDSTVDCRVVPITDKAVFFPKDPEDLKEFHARVNEIKITTKALLKDLLPEIDVIHSHSHPFGFDMRPFAGFPHVITMHGPVVFKELSYYLKRKHLNYVSISKNQQEAAPDLNFIGNVYNGEDPERFPVVSVPKNYVCFLGRFDSEKNPHLAIQLAINAGVPIKVAGKIDFLGKDYFQKEIKPLLRHPLVEYLGELEFKEKVKLISNAMCNLHPTGFREPFGLTILEAAYCGTPTLAIERGSMPELIQDGFTGKLVEDFVEGTHQLKQCAEMDREYIARRSRRLFNYKKMTKGYVRMYKKAIKSNAKEAIATNNNH